ncbi:MAG: 16S rRNA methyltransferase [Chloroflexota bacterium]
MADGVDAVVQAVQQSRKYRHVYTDIIRLIAHQERQKRSSLKEVTKATKNKLHQISGAYFKQKPAYDRWLASLQAINFDAGGSDTDALKKACRSLLAKHASTKERLPVLDRFYAETLSDLPPISSVLDLACGLNPLTIPWLPLSTSAQYYACDIYTDLADFLGQALPLLQADGHGFCCNLLTTVPTVTVDLALLLKTLPVLEQLERGRSLELLRGLNTAYLLVSFPAQSLGGQNKGMRQSYADWFISIIQAEPWQVQMFNFETEIAFLIRKN